MNCESLLGVAVLAKRRNALFERPTLSRIAFGLIVVIIAAAVGTLLAHRTGSSEASTPPIRPNHRSSTTTTTIVVHGGLPIPGGLSGETTTSLAQAPSLPAPSKGAGSGSIPKGSTTTAAPAPSGTPPPAPGGSGGNSTSTVSPTTTTTTTTTTRPPPPVANDDSYSWTPLATADGSAWQSAILTVRNNDSATTTYDYIQADSDPVHGDITYRQSDGTFLFKPKHNGHFKDSFTYHLENRATGQRSATATVNVEVFCNQDYVCDNM